MDCSTGPMECKVSSLKLFLKQLTIVMAASIINIPTGMMQTWNNVFAVHIANNNSTISSHEIEISSWHMDVVASIFEIGGCFGFFVAGHLLANFGRKGPLLMTALPGIFGSTIIAMAVNTNMIIFGRFLDGVAAGMSYITVNTYIAEVSDPTMRGNFSVLSIFMIQLGCLLAIAGSIIFTWYYLSIICVSLLLAHILMSLSLQESPAFLAVSNKEDKALQILKVLREPNADLTMELAYLKEQNQFAYNAKGYKALFERQHFKTIFLVSGMFLILHFSGNLITRINGIRILQELGSLAIEERYAATLFVLAQFCGNIISALTVDFIGRKRSLIISLSIVAASCLSLGTNIYIEGSTPCNDPDHLEAMQTVYFVEDMEPLVEGSSETLLAFGNWIPLALLICIFFGHGVGIGTITYVLPYEMFPTTLRSQGAGVCMMISNIIGFISLTFYTPILRILSLAGLFWLFGSVSFMALFYVHFLLLETSGIKLG